MKKMVILLVSMLLYIYLVSASTTFVSEKWYKGTDTIIIEDITYTLAFDKTTDAVMISSPYSYFNVRKNKCETKGYYKFCFNGFQYQNLIPERTEANLNISKIDCINYTYGTDSGCKVRVSGSCIQGVECASGICFHNICTFKTPICGDGFCDGNEITTCQDDCLIATTTTTTTTTTFLQPAQTTTTQLNVTTTASVASTLFIPTFNPVTTTLDQEASTKKKLYLIVLIVSLVMLINTIGILVYIKFRRSRLIDPKVLEQKLNENNYVASTNGQKDKVKLDKKTMQEETQELNELAQKLNNNTIEEGDDDPFGDRNTP